MKGILLISFFACAGLWLAWQFTSPVIDWYKLRRAIRNMKPGSKFQARGKVHTLSYNSKDWEWAITETSVILYDEIKEVY